MDDNELQDIARFLLECREALSEQGSGTETVMVYLNRLYDAIERLRIAVAEDPHMKPLLGMMQDQANTLKRRIEVRLGIQN